MFLSTVSRNWLHNFGALILFAAYADFKPVNGQRLIPFHTKFCSPSQACPNTNPLAVQPDDRQQSKRHQALLPDHAQLSNCMPRQSFQPCN